MPNASNILAPACLVGAGRSGTTLVTAMLRRHPQVQALGETGNLIYSPLFHIERALPLCGPGFTRENAPGAAVDQVRRMVMDFFPSEAPRWFHKPILLPSVRRMFKDDETFVEWFWDAGERLFPEGRWFTVVRDWQDVARSSMRRWGWTPQMAVQSQVRLSQMLLHKRSRVGLVIDFATLVAEPEASTRRLLDFLGLPFDPACLGPFDQAHAPNRDGAELDTVETIRARGFTHEGGDGEPLRSRLLDRLQVRLRRRIA